VSMTVAFALHLHGLHLGQGSMTADCMDMESVWRLQIMMKDRAAFMKDGGLEA